MASSPKLISPNYLNFVFLIFFSLTHFSFSLRSFPIDSYGLNSIKSITDVHDLLPEYGLPKGLLPNNVKSYKLSDGGVFEIELQSTCYVQFDKLVYYDKKIKGKLSYGSVSDVSGIQAKKLFFWVYVTGIKADVDSGMVEFFVGSLSEKLPAGQFEDIPACKGKACIEAHSGAMRGSPCQRRIPRLGDGRPVNFDVSNSFRFELFKQLKQHQTENKVVDYFFPSVWLAAIDGAVSEDSAN